MRIVLTKLSDRQHALEIVRGDGSRERVEVVTREFLFHDLLHYAVESAMPTQGGFWGVLARGKTLADLNDRSGEPVREHAGTLGVVEGAVGMLSGAMKRDAADADVVAAVHGYHASLGREPPPFWTERFVADVRERMRRLQGQWKATPYGESMEIVWDEPRE